MPWPTPGGVPVKIEVARVEGDRLGDERDEVRDAEDHVGGGVVLADLAVHAAPDPERLGVRDLVGGDDPRTGRRERVERLAADPLRVAELQIARRDVVAARVAEDDVERAGLGHASRGAPITTTSSAS